MSRALTIVAILVAAALFAWVVPLTRLFDAFQSMITALSIMVAAVFVRLNRGMPTLEWKSVNPEARTQLTSRMVELSTEYGWIILVYGVALMGLVAISIVGKAQVTATWPDWAQRMGAAAIGAMAASCVGRMGYVVWRDIDVVKLQKQVIDDLAVRETSEQNQKRAEDKLASIRSSGLRRVDIPQPKAWGE